LLGSCCIFSSCRVVTLCGLRHEPAFDPICGQRRIAVPLFDYCPSRFIREFQLLLSYPIAKTTEELGNLDSILPHLWYPMLLKRNFQNFSVYHGGLLDLACHVINWVIRKKLRPALKHIEVLFRFFAVNSKYLVTDKRTFVKVLLVIDPKGIRLLSIRTRQGLKTNHVEVRILVAGRP